MQKMVAAFQYLAYLSRMPSGKSKEIFFILADPLSKHFLAHQAILVLDLVFTYVHYT